MTGKIGIPVFFIFFMFMLSIAGALDVTAASTIVVNGTSIQEAVNMANDGDEIIVYAGIYRENIVVDKSVSIQSYDGADDTVVEAPDMSKSVFHVTADYVNISGFTMNEGWQGIFLDTASHCTIQNNSVEGNCYIGIHLEFSHYNIIMDNNVNSNDNDGICLSYSHNNRIEDNVANSNREDGISLYLGDNNRVVNNIAKTNSMNGLGIYASGNNTLGNNSIALNLDGISLTFLENFMNRSSNNIIKSNNISNNRVGVNLTSSFNNIIKSNTANFNDKDGLCLYFSNNNSIEDNTASSNGENGINLFSTYNNTLKGNVASSNSMLGINLEGSSNNIVTNSAANSNNISGIALLPVSDGITLYVSDNNILNQNIANSNIEYGITSFYGVNNTIEKNIALNNGYGIALAFSFNNTVIENIANSNNKYGIFLTESNNNTLKANIATDNRGGAGFGGIALSTASYNFIVGNIINANSWGIIVDSSHNNIFKDNAISRNHQGISLTSSVKNNIFHNNLIDNGIQSYDDCFGREKNVWHHQDLWEGNYWSDYIGADDGSGRGKHETSGDGIGDSPDTIPHYDDYYPYVNISGWLTSLISQEYWDFGTVYQGRSKNATFEIQNKGVHDLTILSISADPNIVISGIKLSMEIPKGSSKTFNVTIDATNLEGDVLRSVGIITDDAITPDKTILIYGFVKPPVHDVRVTDIDFDSRVIKGQIDVFNVSISNYGSFDEHNLSVELKDGTDVIGTVPIPELLAGENVTVSYHWDTKDAASGIHNIAIEVRLRNKDLLDSIGVKVNVLSSSEASTLIITNFERMSELWGENETTKLEEKLIVLSFNPCVNGIIINVGKSTNCSDAYKSWKEDILNPEEANKVSEEIKQVVESKLEEYRGVKYIILVGDDRVIPFYRLTDNSDKAFIGVLAWPTENDYAMDLRTANTTISSALGENQMLTDDFYVDFNPEETSVEWADILHIPDMSVGRLVESPEEICITIETFIVRGDSVNPDKIFLTAYDFMNDSGSNCARVLETLTLPKVMSKGKDVRANYNRSSEISDELLANRSDIIAIFQHADHSHFILYPVSGDDESISVTSMDISNASADLNGSIVYTMSCHSGLNVPPDDKNDLVEAYISKKVLAYVAPTGYGIGSEISVAGHEKLLYYFTKYLCEGVDVGTALMYAKRDYYALEFDFDHIDSKVASTMIVYGLPMYRVNIEKLEKAEYLTTKSVSSLGVPDKKGKIEVATLTLRPSYSFVETAVGDYYYSEDYQSDSGKPIQPKATWSYIARDKKMLHGMVLKSASYKDEENFNPVIDSFVVSPTKRQEEIGFDAKNWYPSNFFKINTVGDKQFLIVISGQYNPRKGTQRLYNETTFDIYISAENEENPRPPEIIGVHAIRSENATNIRVNATDNDSGIYKVILAYTDAKGEWREWLSKDLKEGEEGLWTCDIPTKEEIEFFVQAVDIYGNVAVDDNDGAYYPEKGDKLPGQS